MTEDKPISTLDIKSILPYINVISYDKLINMSIDDIIRSLPIVILYQHFRDYGHWVCMWKLHDKIMFFDSYGNYPDNKTLSGQNSYNDNSIQLLKKLYNSRFQIDYNNYQLQATGSNTCGKWCIVRLLFPYLSHDDFYKINKRYAEKNMRSMDENIMSAYNILK